jgi:hypothetical protein
VVALVANELDVLVEPVELCELRCSQRRPLDLWVDDFPDSLAYRDECGSEWDEDPLPRLVEYRLPFYLAYLGYHYL